MFKFILSCFYFFLPAYLANATPPLAARAGILNFLARPIDGGRNFLGRPFLGSHKTWRGLVLGILAGFLTVLLQAYLWRFPAFREISIIDYQKINLLFFAFWLPAGAVFGDLLSAFAKRRLNLAPGAKFLPFDQTNYVIGAFIFLWPFFDVKPDVWPVLFVLTFFLHIIVNRLGYSLKLHKAKW